jgi:large subunit ribosomal protein L10
VGNLAASLGSHRAITDLKRKSSCRSAWGLFCSLIILKEVKPLAISKKRKDQLVLEYKELIEQSRALFLAEYAGLTVKDMEALRDKVREAGGQFSVTKNTLLYTALVQSEQEVPADFLNGQLATGFAMAEIPSLAKALTEAAKANDNLVIRGGIMDGQMLSVAEIEALADLPSLDQLRAQIIGLLSAPAQNIASVLGSGVRQVVNVVDAYSRSEESAAEAA